MYSSSPPGGGSLINMHTATLLQPSQSIKELICEGSRVQGAAAVALAQSHTPHVRAHPSSAPSTRADCLIAGHILCTCSRPLLFSPPCPPSLTAAVPAAAFASPYTSCCPGYQPQQFSQGSPTTTTPLPPKLPQRNPPSRLVPSSARLSDLPPPDSFHPARRRAQKPGCRPNSHTLTSLLEKLEEVMTAVHHYGLRWRRSREVVVEAAARGIRFRAAVLAAFPQVVLPEHFERGTASGHHPR